MVCEMARHEAFPQAESIRRRKQKPFGRATKQNYPRGNRLQHVGSLLCGGDKTPLELFLAGVRGWEAGLRRRLDNDKSKQD